jgi:hypothetical protein
MIRFEYLLRNMGPFLAVTRHYSLDFEFIQHTVDENELAQVYIICAPLHAE